jgi:hypothetical protein
VPDHPLVEEVDEGLDLGKLGHKVQSVSLG